MELKRLHRFRAVISVLAAALFLMCAGEISAAFAAAPDDEQELFSVTFQTPSGDFTYLDAPIEPTDYLVADEIASRGINAPLSVKRGIMSRAVKSGATFERAVTLCMPKAAQFVDELEKATFEPPTDAEMTFDPSQARPFRVRRERRGKRLDRERTFELIYISVLRVSRDSLAAPTLPIPPLVTASELVKATYTRGSFATQYSESNADRSHNIALALSKLSGTVLKPGEELSFNAVVGKRTASRGFRQAKIIVDGDYVTGWGGGVCQASTTLYNAALLAGMEITAVYNHSLVSGYIEPSFDAMVNSSGADLKFRNPTDAPVYIAASAAGGTARVKIYGVKPEFDIVRKSVVLEHISPPDAQIIVDTEHKYLPAEATDGDSFVVRAPKDGLKSEAYLEYYRGGVLVCRKRIRSDTYRAVGGITAVPE